MMNGLLQGDECHLNKVSKVTPGQYSIINSTNRKLGKKESMEWI